MALFLEKRMEKFSSETDVQDFLELFTSMRGYQQVTKVPKDMDARVRQGEKVREQVYSLNIQEVNDHWKVDVSFQVNAISGSIYRYAFRLPKSERGSVSVTRRQLQFISNFIR